jgi:chemotaxis signal transduction protein
MKSMNAWSIEVGKGRFAALGDGHLKHLVDRPQLFDVPHTPAGCGRVFAWNQDIIPVWDVPRSLGVTDQPVEASVLAIIAFQLHRDSPVVVAGIALVAPPVRIVISDPASCALPDPARAWQRIAHACFQHGEQVLPVLDFRKMFGVAPDWREPVREQEQLRNEAAVA